MNETQRNTILAIKDLMTTGRVSSNLKNEVDVDEISKVIKDIKDWCKYNINKIIRKRIGKGAFGSIYNSCITESCSPPMILRVVEYDDNFKHVKSSERPENSEWIIHNLLYKTLTRYNVYNITTPIFSYSCKVKNLEEEVKDKLVDTFYSTPKCIRMTFTDFANRGSLLDDMQKVKYTDSQLMTAILQVLLTLCTVYRDYPNYRHNDLHIGNLLVIDIENKKPLKYVIAGKTYIIEKPDFLVLLNDFDYNSIYPSYKNAKVRSMLQDVETLPSSYYDVHKFINSMLSIPTSSDFEKISPDVMKFLKEIVPTFLRGAKKGHYIDYYQIMWSKEFDKIVNEEKIFKYREYTPNNLIKKTIFQKYLSS
jgi:hypothetical protein